MQVFFGCLFNSIHINYKTDKQCIHNETFHSVFLSLLLLLAAKVACKVEAHLVDMRHSRDTRHSKQRDFVLLLYYNFTWYLYYMFFHSFLLSTFAHPIIQCVYPPEVCIMIVFNFSWDMKMTQEKS